MRFFALTRPAVTGIRLWPLIRRWRRNATTRAQLSRLSPDALKDIGIGPGAARREAARPFWMP